MPLRNLGKYLIFLFKLTFVSFGVIYLMWQVATLFLPFDDVTRFASNLTGIQVSQLTLPVSSDIASQRPIDTIYLSSYGVFFVLSVILAITGTVVLSRGRSFFDAIGIFTVFAIPRKRDYTASVMDAATFRPIAFATIYLISKEGGKDKVILDTISDLNGQYKIYLKESKADLYLQARVSGYEPYEKPIGNLYQNNVLQDILMKSNESIKENRFKTYFYSVRPKLFKALIYSLFLMCLFYVLFVLSGFIIYGVSFTLAFLGVIYGSALIWNSFILYEIAKFSPGKILDFSTGKVIQSAIIEFFDKTKQLQSISTPEDGIIRVDLAEGVYRVQANKSGYEMVSKDGNSVNSDEMLINKEGYLARNVYLKGTSENQAFETKDGLLNPFS